MVVRIPCRSTASHVVAIVVVRSCGRQREEAEAGGSVGEGGDRRARGRRESEEWEEKENY